MFGLGKTGGKSWLGAGFFAAMVALALSLASPARAQDTRLPVGASFSILADIVKVVGGDRVDVTTLVGPDQDTHVYENPPARNSSSSTAWVSRAGCRV